MSEAVLDIKDFDIKEFLPYSEREIFSQRYDKWKRYEVKKPKDGPQTDKEMKTRWVDKFRPVGLAAYTGRDNEPTRKGMMTVIDMFEANNKLANITCITGPRGSGKSTFANSLAVGICAVLNIDNDRVAKSKFLLHANCRGQKSRYFDELWANINKHGTQRDDGDSKANFRLVLLDDFDCVPLPNQMNLKQIMETLAHRLRFIMVTSSVDKLAGYIEGRLTATQTYATNVLTINNALLIVLNALYKSKCGYNREGIEELFKLNKNMNLSKILDDAQEIFKTRRYVSKENVLAHHALTSGKKLPKPTVHAWAVIEPLERCTICTLFPPCKHTTVDDLVEAGAKHKASLPSYRGGMICPEFARKGVCSMFNNTGHCSLSHPHKFHKVILPIERCKRCSLPWPCEHCTYTTERRKLLEHIAEAKIRRERLAKICSPNPPGNYVAPLTKHFPDWREDMKEISRLCGGQERKEFLEECEQWVIDSRDTDEDVYYKKDKLVRFAFGPMLDTPMLQSPEELKYYDIADPLALLDEEEEALADAA